MAIGSEKAVEDLQKSSENPALGSEKRSEKILQILRQSPDLSAKDLSRFLNITPRAVEKQIANLRDEGRLQRIGPARGGRWEVIENQGQAS